MPFRTLRCEVMTWACIGILFGRIDTDGCERIHTYTLSTSTIPLPKSPPPPLLRDWTAHNPSFGTCFILLMILGSQSGICDEGFHLTKCRKTSRASRGSKRAPSRNSRASLVPRMDWIDNFCAPNFLLRFCRILPGFEENQKQQWKIEWNPSWKWCWTKSNVQVHYFYYGWCY